MELKGLEIHFSAMKAKLQSREDCLVLTVHVILLNRDLKCVGTGDEWPEEGCTEPSEVLPDDWNTNQEVYTLRYVSKSGTRYLVKVVTIPGCLLVNVLNVNDEKVASISLDTDRYVTEDFGNFSSCYINLDQLWKCIEDKVFKKLDNKSAIPAEQQQYGSIEGYDPFAQLFTQPSLMEPQASGYRYPSVGRGDLDPFSRGQGGGMLMDPSSMGMPSRSGVPEYGIGGPGELPRGAVPPGARFDPFGPPIRGRGSFQPNPDFYPPPGFDNF